MASTKAKRLPWKIVFGGVIANTFSVLCLPYCLYFTYLIFKYSPDPIVAAVLALWFTPIVMEMPLVLANIYGCFSALVDFLIGTQLCPLMSLFSFSIYKPLGKFCFGYEVHGKENLPRTTGGLVVYHHNLIAYDLLYLMTDYYLENGKPLYGIIHKDVELANPGVCKVLNFFASKDVLIKKLKQGEICAVAPGGSFESMFSQNYELLWNGRVGFAAVAKECGVPIIPMFTANGQEAMPIKIPFFRDFFLKVYEKTRYVPYMPLMQLPSKLRTYLGEPIFCGPDESPAEFAKRTQMAIYSLRDKHQRPDATPLTAILERFGYRRGTPNRTAEHE